MKVTAEMIAEVPAGLQLDAWLAEFVMGWEKQPSLYPVCFKDERGFIHRIGGHSFMVFAPSVGISDAWRVVEAMQKHVKAGTCGPSWWNFWQSGYTHIWELSAEDAAARICRAALTAVVVEVPSYEELFGKLHDIYKRGGGIVAIG
jgi:hypothetical protein